MASRTFKIHAKKSTMGVPKNSEDPLPTKIASEREVAALAYEYWLGRGCPLGSDQEDWFRAENSLKSRNGQDHATTLAFDVQNNGRNQ